MQSLSFNRLAGSGRLNVLLARVPGLVRTYHPLVKLVVVGLLAIAASGVLCGLIGWRFGRAAVAGDTLSASLSPTRCAQLLRNEPRTMDCHYAELLDHSDEVVLSRLGAAPIAAVVALAYMVARRKWFRDAESASVRRVGLLLGFGAFGFAAILLLPVAGVRVLIDRDTAGLGRWLADGFVATAVCLIYGWLVFLSRRWHRPSAA